jgi:hypothetical protein
VGLLRAMRRRARGPGSDSESGVTDSDGNLNFQDGASIAVLTCSARLCAVGPCQCRLGGSRRLAPPFKLGPAAMLPSRRRRSKLRLPQARSLPLASSFWSSDSEPARASGCRCQWTSGEWQALLPVLMLVLATVVIVVLVVVAASSNPNLRLARTEDRILGTQPPSGCRRPGR